MRIEIGLKHCAIGLVQRHGHFPRPGPHTGEGVGQNHAPGCLPEHHPDGPGAGGELVFARQRRHADHRALDGRAAIFFSRDFGVAGGQTPQSDQRCQQDARRQRPLPARPVRQAKLHPVAVKNQRQKKCQQGQRQKRRAGARHHQRDDIDTQAQRPHGDLVLPTRCGQQPGAERQRAHHEFGEEVAVDKGRRRVRPLPKQAEIQQELQHRPERGHPGTPVNGADQKWQVAARESVEPKPHQQAENKPANRLHRRQIGVRPGHAAKGKCHQAQRQPHHVVPAWAVWRDQPVSAALSPKKCQRRTQPAQSDQHRFQRVLQ